MGRTGVGFIASCVLYLARLRYVKLVAKLEAAF